MHIRRHALWLDSSHWCGAERVDLVFKDRVGIRTRRTLQFDKASRHSRLRACIMVSVFLIVLPPNQHLSAGWDINRPVPCPLMSRREKAVPSVHMLAPVASCDIRFTAAKRCIWDILVMRGMELCGWADTTIRYLREIRYSPWSSPNS